MEGHTPAGARNIRYVVAWVGFGVIWIRVEYRVGLSVRGITTWAWFRPHIVPPLAPVATLQAAAASIDREVQRELSLPVDNILRRQQSPPGTQTPAHSPHAGAPALLISPAEVERRTRPCAHADRPGCECIRAAIFPRSLCGRCREDGTCRPP
ncbi:hypothetical protein GQ53DRAFT_750122 [Thozetella sp. PMI_491]|nr:hypothetical protein GQ53DRAFT_750122 [Thozetella sp. PMI_491]